jgi:hypothetical protein
MEIVSTEEYWQLILNDLSKVGQITTEDEEFNKIATYTWSVLQNTLVPSEDENYIKSFEEMIEIDGEGLDVLQRKVNILTTLSTKKYVPKNLVKLALNKLGIERVEIDYDRNGNKVTVTTDNLNEELLTNVTNLVNNVVSDKIEKEMDNLGFIPEGWTRVEWLENHVPNANSPEKIILPMPISMVDDSLEIETEYQTGSSFDTWAEGNVFSLEGICSPSPHYVWLAWGVLRDNSDNLLKTYIGYGQKLYGATAKLLPHVDFKEWHNYKINLNKGSFKFYVDDVLEWNVWKEPFSTVDGLAIFGPMGANHALPQRKRKYKQKINGVLVYDLLPCLDDTGAPCMYDRVSKTAFYNSGKGDFTYPTQSTTYSLRRRVLPDWGKLTEYGLRRLYHAPADYEGELIEYALEHDYKQIIETEMPEDGHWTPQWKETEEEIVLEWIETEEPILEQPITE